jgi:hypothetical protein
LTNGVTISLAAAADLVGVIDKLAHQCAPQVLARRIVVLRHQLIECCTNANASEGVSAKVDEPQDVLLFRSDAVVDTKAAAKRLGITDAGVRWLCRKERIVAKQDSSGRWWIDAASLDEAVIDRKQQSRGRKCHKN